MYRSTLVQFSSNLSMTDLFSFVYISMFALWLEFFLLLFAIGFATEALLIMPWIERGLYFVMDRLCTRAERSFRQKARVRNLSMLVGISAEDWTQAEIAKFLAITPIWWWFRGSRRILITARVGLGREDRPRSLQRLSN
jgi:hypothetical protein